MGERLVIYGATGYTGKLVAAVAKAHKLKPLLSARDGGKLLKVSGALGFDAQTARLDDPASLDRMLGDAAVLLNVAGPFTSTAKPMIEACLRHGVHYVDITGEIEVIEDCALLDATARGAGVTLLPGCGFDAVASDCLAAHVAERLNKPARISIAISGLDRPSRGTARIVLARLNRGTPIYRNGGLVELAQPLTCDIDFGAGPKEVVMLGAGDLSAVHHSTGIPNVEVYFEAIPSLKRMYMLKRRFGWLVRKPGVQRWMEKKISRWPEGPTPSQRDRSSCVVIADAMTAEGKHAVGRLKTPNAYTLTALTAIACARKVLEGRIPPGFMTPSKAFGADFILKFPGVKREDLA